MGAPDHQSSGEFRPTKSPPGCRTFPGQQQKSKVAVHPPKISAALPELPATTGQQLSKPVADPSARGPAEWDPKGEAAGSPEPRAPVEPAEAEEAPLEAGRAEKALPVPGAVLLEAAHLAVVEGWMIPRGAFPLVRPPRSRRSASPPTPGGSRLGLPTTLEPDRGARAGKDRYTRFGSLCSPVHPFPRSARTGRSRETVIRKRRRRQFHSIR
jgi:hypothetical protein